MNTLRSPQTQHRYDLHLEKKHECFLCNDNEEVQHNFWRVYNNDFPYDRIFKVSKLLSPRRHIQDIHELTVREWVELGALYKKYQREYDCILINTPRKKSVKHLHFHLLIYR